MGLLLLAHGSWLALDLWGGGLAALWPLTLVVAAAGFGALYGAVKAAALRAPGPLSILAVAMLLRLLLLPLAPTLSNDALRYLWDGRVLVEGHDPYLLAPDAEELRGLRDGLWNGLHHREVPTVYPPLAMSLFAAVAALPASWPLQLLALKALLVLADLLTCGGLVYIAGRRRLGTAPVISYAWNPLVTLEVAGMGHVDALGVAAVVVGVCLWLRGSCSAYGAGEASDGSGAPPGAAGSKMRPARLLAVATALVAGVLAKLVPVILAPLWAAASRRPWRFGGAVTALLAVGFAPLALRSEGVPPGLVRYGVSWEFNGPLYEPLWRALEAVDSRAWGEAVLNRVKAVDDHDPFWNRFYPYNYARLHAKILLAGALAAFLLTAAWRARRGADPVALTGRALGAGLLCTATFYPWYALWVLPWAALQRHRAWLVLSALLFISYAPQHAGFAHWPGTFALVWVPFVVLLWREPGWGPLRGGRP